MEHHDATGVSPRDKRCEKLVRTGINGCSAMARPLTHLTHGISTRRPFHPGNRLPEFLSLEVGAPVVYPTLSCHRTPLDRRTWPKNNHLATGDLSHELGDARPRPLAPARRRGSLCRHPNDGCGEQERSARDCCRVRQALSKSRRSCQDTWRKRHQRCCCATGQNRLAGLDWLSPSPSLIQKHNGLKDGQQRGINAASSGI